MSLFRRYLYLLPMIGLQGACAVGGGNSPVDVEPVVVPPATPMAELGFGILHKADYNLDDSVTMKSFKTLRSELEYQTELGRYSIEVPAGVDFSAKVVLASTMGSQLSGGFIIGVQRVAEFADNVEVTVELVSPGANCVTTPAISNPWEFVEIPTVKPLKIIEIARTLEC